MSNRGWVAPVLVTAIMAGSVVGAMRAEGREATCSASHMDPQTEDQEGLTAKADDMRSAIRRAAVNCQFQRLEDLGLAGSRYFTYSYGDSGIPAGYWRDADEAGDKTLAKLVRILDTPYVESDQVYGDSGKRTFVWPSAMRKNPTAGDWKALEGIYSQRKIRSFKRHGYLGHRVFITARSGDWTVFVAGD